MLKTLSIAAACAMGCLALTLGVAAAKPGHHGASAMKGRTKQGRSIRMARKGQAVQLKHFSIKLRCHDGSILIDAESGFLPTPLKGGKLNDHQVGSTDDVWLRAHLHGKVVRGRIRVHDRIGKIRCDSRWVPFHAAAHGGS